MINKNNRMINKNLTREEIYYIAGVLDGGSSFNIFNSKKPTRPSGSWNALVTITNCEMALLNHLNKMIFFDDSSIVCVYKENIFARQINRLRLEGPILDVILPVVKDVLVVKKRHAELMYEFRQSVLGEFGKREVTLEMQQYREAIAAEMKKLNESVPRGAAWVRKSGKKEG